jgi:hypothetical protein
MLRKSAVVVLSAITTVLVAGLAAADEQFDIKAEQGEITIVTKGHWHVNKDYSWKVTIGDKVLDKTKFSLTDASAKVSGVPHGTGKVKGAVCNGDQCLPFTREVTVP